MSSFQDGQRRTRPPIRRVPPDSTSAPALVLYGVGIALALIGTYVFSGTLLQLLEWVRSPEPWWR